MSDNPLPLPAPAPEPEPEQQVEIVGRGFQPPSKLNPKEERESQTARLIAITLLWMLGITAFINLISIIVLTWRNRLDAAPVFERMFSIWLPLLSGLVGSAVGFYLTKEKK